MSILQNTLTNTIKLIVRVGLWCYFKELRIEGFSKKFHKLPVIFVANHQNALLDALIIAAHTHRKTTFITRSDVFKNPIIGAFLRYIGMLPIFRFRDGVDTLKKNAPIFKQCGHILASQESILIFPEGNHGFERKLRPLKKGFVSLLAERWEIEASSVYLYPLGLNYESLAQFPDRASFIFGTPMEVAPFEISTAETQALLKKLAFSLQKLTTHIPFGSQEEYQACLDYLNSIGTDFLSPGKANIAVEQYVTMESGAHHSSVNTTGNFPQLHQNRTGLKSVLKTIFKGLFMGLNAFPIFIWRSYIKPGIAQIEFVSTLRFAFCMAFFPFFYGLLFGLIYIFTKEIGTAIAVPMVLFIFNIVSVKKIM